MRKLEGKLVAGDMKVGIIAARFNEFITGQLLDGAMDGLLRHDAKEENIDVAWVPGAFEIPLIASRMAKSGKYDAIICLGAVIRGSTTHYDYVCSEVSKGIASVSLASDIPVLFGVLTTENIEQAIERAGTKAGNKGYDCALSAIEMVNLIREIGQKGIGEDEESRSKYYNHFELNKCIHYLKQGIYNTELRGVMLWHMSKTNIDVKKAVEKVKLELGFPNVYAAKNGDVYQMTKTDF